MKILFSIHDNFDTNGGGAGATAGLAAALRQRGHEVEVTSFDALQGPRRFKRHVFPLYVAARVLRHGKYDLIDCAHGDAWALVKLWGTFRPRSRPTLVTRNHVLEHRRHEELVQETRLGRHHLSWKYWLYNGTWRLHEVATSLRGADAVVSLNGSERQYLIDRIGLDPARSFCSSNGIAGVLIDRARTLATMPVPEMRPKNIAFIGSYIPMKGITYLVEGMTRVLSDRPETRLTCYGCKTEPNFVLSSFPEVVRKRVTVVPYFRNSEMPEMLADDHIVVYPSLYESFGLAPLEGMACGLVPVCSNIPGPDNYMADGVNGLTVPPRDAGALASAVLELIDDPGKWTRLREGALQTAAQASWAEVAAHTEEIYGEAARFRDGSLLRPANLARAAH